MRAIAIDNTKKGRNTQVSAGAAGRRSTLPLPLTASKHGSNITTAILLLVVVIVIDILTNTLSILLHYMLLCDCTIARSLFTLLHAYKGWTLSSACVDVACK